MAPGHWVPLEMGDGMSGQSDALWGGRGSESATEEPRAVQDTLGALALRHFAIFPERITHRPRS